jgi:rhodanese-related sulfurtransferase
MSDDDEPAGRPAQHSGRALVVAGVAAAALFVVYLVLGMPGMDHGPSGGEESSMASMDHGSMSYESLQVRDFEARMSTGAFVVNVHRPYEGEIDGTDVFIDYDEIVGDHRLPSATNAPIVLYCETGRMSAIAAEALVSAGYTDVAHLEGGMVAWDAAGMPVFRQQS